MRNMLLYALSASAVRLLVGLGLGLHLDCTLALAPIVSIALDLDGKRGPMTHSVMSCIISTYTAFCLGIALSPSPPIPAETLGLQSARFGAMEVLWLSLPISVACGYVSHFVLELGEGIYTKPELDEYYNDVFDGRSWGRIKKPLMRKVLEGSDGALVCACACSSIICIFSYSPALRNFAEAIF